MEKCKLSCHPDVKIPFKKIDILVSRQHYMQKALFLWESWRVPRWSKLHFSGSKIWDRIEDVSAGRIKRLPSRVVLYVHIFISTYRAGSSTIYKGNRFLDGRN